MEGQVSGWMKEWQEMGETDGQTDECYTDRWMEGETRSGNGEHCVGGQALGKKWVGVDCEDIGCARCWLQWRVTRWVGKRVGRRTDGHLTD